MVITVHIDTKLFVYTVVIDIKGSELSFNLEGFLDTIKGTLLRMTLRQWEYQEDMIVT
jgi:hypothetical protein